MDDKLILKNNLKEVRNEKNLSQTDLAKLVGVSRNTISSIETGQFNPTAKLALILCIALEKKFEELLGELIYKPPGKPALVPESDKRPAMNTAIEDFKE